ncbi:MAG: ATP-binding protein [Myxococcaceae bacterium]
MKTLALRMTLREKLLAITLLGVLMPLVLILGTASMLELRAIQRELLSQIKVTAATASEFVAAAVAFQDKDSCAKTLRLLSRRPDVVAARLYDLDDTLFCSYQRPGEPAPPAMETVNSQALSQPRTSADAIEVLWPAEYEGQRYGRLYLKISTESVTGRRRVLLWGAALGLLGVFVFIVLLGWTLERVVSRPILALAAATQRVTQVGDYSVRVMPTSRDEIGELAVEYNKMIAEIDRRTCALVRSEHALKQSYEELAQTQEELVKKERLAAVGELAAVMAHEVRNPLGAIFNSLVALERRVTPGAQVKELFEILKEEADRLSRIVEDLLDFARPHVPQLKPVSMARIIASAVEVAAHNVMPQGAGPVKMEISDELPPVPVDERMIRQVFINLVLNALQSAPGGARVMIKADLDDVGWARIEVADQGQGMDSTTLARVFEPFFTTKAQGTGLGLAVVRRFVEAHGGQVGVSSVPKRGSVFTVRLPIPEEHEDTGASLPSSTWAPLPLSSDGRQKQSTVAK